MIASATYNEVGSVEVDVINSGGDEVLIDGTMTCRSGEAYLEFSNGSGIILKAKEASKSTFRSLTIPHAKLIDALKDEVWPKGTTSDQIEEETNWPLEWKCHISAQDDTGPLQKIVFSTDTLRFYFGKVGIKFTLKGYFT